MTATPALPATRCRRRVYLMRHADFRYFDAGDRPLEPRTVPLTAEGRDQAQSAAQLLEDIRFDAATCSAVTTRTARRTACDTYEGDIQLVSSAGTAISFSKSSRARGRWNR